MTLHSIPSEFPYYMIKIFFYFYQCRILNYFLIGRIQNRIRTLDSLCFFVCQRQGNFMLPPCQLIFVFTSHTSFLIHNSVVYSMMNRNESSVKFLINVFFVFVYEADQEEPIGSANRKGFSTCLLPFPDTQHRSALTQRVTIRETE